MNDTTPQSPDPAPTGNAGPISRFAWQSGGLVVGRGAALVSLVLIARDLGQETYGEFVVLLALLELATVPWKPTVQQGAAARLGVGASHRSWRSVMIRWWFIGAVVVGPLAWMFAGPIAALVIVAASAANGLMAEYIPEHILAGEQRRIAVAIGSSQIARLAITLGFIATGILSPEWAIAIHGAGYLIGAILLRSSGHRGAEPIGMLWAETGSEGLRWVELHGPVLIVALFLGLETAGGFDILFKLATAIAELLAGVGIIVLPAMVRSDRVANVVARGTRLPTFGALLIALGFAVLAGPALEAALGFEIDSAIAPALLAVPILLGPWMGVSKSALLTSGGSGWLVPSQLAIAVATVAASWLAYYGLGPASASVALAHLSGAFVRWWGVRARGALPSSGEVFSIADLRADMQWAHNVMTRRAKGSGIA